jgi:hypothetical protein
MLVAASLIKVPMLRFMVGSVEQWPASAGGSAEAM